MKLRIYPYKEIAINSAFLEIPAEYQRRLQMSKVKQMVAEFNGIILNPPNVSYRDGRYIVIDGQHTIVGLKTLNGGKDLSIVCRVYTGLTKEEEALVFAQQTGASTPLSAGAKLRAKLVDGALAYLDCPYRWGGRTPAGVDCSGLCHTAYLLQGLPIQIHRARRGL